MTTSSTPASQSQDQGPPDSVSLTVFDDYISSASGAANATVTAYTHSSFDDLLGFYDQIAIQVVVNDTTVRTAPATLTVQIAHSADGRNYVNKNAAPEVSTPTQLNIGTPTYMSFGYDGGEYPSLGWVRLVVVLKGAAGPVRARVRITAVGNNLNEQAFTRAMVKNMGAQSTAAQKYVLVYGAGQRISKDAISELVFFIKGLPSMSDSQINNQVVAYQVVLATPSVHSNREVDAARAFMMWKPILLLKNKGRFDGPAIVVPKDFMIAFLGNGHYVLVKDGVSLWQSTSTSSALFQKPGNLAVTAGVGVKE